MQEFGSSLGKPSFRGGRRGGDGLVFVNLGVVPNARNMLGVLQCRLSGVRIDWLVAQDT